MPTALDQRSALRSLSTLALRDLSTSFRAVDLSDLAVAQDQFAHTVLPALGARYGSASSALAVNWYGQERALAGVGGAYTALPAALPDIGRYESMAAWAMRFMTRDVALKVAAPLVLTALGVGLSRVVMNAHRETIIESTDNDPQTEGWTRHGGDVSPCDFCRMLIARGAVYTRKSSRFVAHDHCSCVAAPAFRGYGKKHGTIPQIARRVSDKNISDSTKQANNARAYEWMQDHYH